MYTLSLSLPRCRKGFACLSLFLLGTSPAIAKASDVEKGGV